MNLTGAIYSEFDPHPQFFPPLESSGFLSIVATQLASHYLPKTRNHASPLKYVIFLGFLGVSDLFFNENPRHRFTNDVAGRKRRGMRI